VAIVPRQKSLNIIKKNILFIISSDLELMFPWPKIVSTSPSQSFLTLPIFFSPFSKSQTQKKKPKKKKNLT
jgi:hypothetical protein